MDYNRISHCPWVRRSALFLAALALACVAQIAAAQSAAAATYYISPNGNDNNNGTATGTAWKTFERAWYTLQPGDTLLLMDGTYTEASTGLIQPNVRNGQSGKPITIKALNDGQATIDGQGAGYPVKLGDNAGPNGAIGDWFVVEGIVARNGGLGAIRIEKGNHNVLRRVSAYNANTDDNSLVLAINWGDGNLVEDCVVAGTGRYMINVFTSSNNTIRRCFAQWQAWDGRNFCGVTWPNGNNVGVYNSSNTTVENVIAYGRSLTGIFIQANDDNAVANNNQILGSMALLQGRDYDGSVWTYGSGQDQPTSRPGPTKNPYGPACDNSITQWWWGNHRTGFSIWGQGELHDNVFRDVLAAGNVGLGLSIAKPYGPGTVGTIIDHATLTNNGSDLVDWESKQGGNIYTSDDEVTVTNSHIDGSQWATQGEGARFKYRYVDRTLTDQPLWPWPMESRVQSELGVSVGEIAAKYSDANFSGFSLRLDSTPRKVDRKGTIELTVNVDIFGKFTNSVKLHVSEDGSGLQISPTDATVTPPAAWKFKVVAPDTAGVHTLKITAAADGASTVERTIPVLVDPQLLYLPAITNQD
jgi:parallel beta-helix repeat protein